MTSSSDFSPMYASTSSINCERTRAVNHRFVSRPSFILSLSSSSAFNQSNPILSQTEKVNPPPLGVRVVLYRARARANSSSSSSRSSSVVTAPFIARTFALGTPVSTAAAIRPGALRRVALSRLHRGRQSLSSVVLDVVYSYVQTVYDFIRAQTRLDATEKERRERWGGGGGGRLIDQEEGRFW